MGGRNREEGSLFGPGGLFGSKADRERADNPGGTGLFTFQSLSMETVLSVIGVVVAALWETNPYLIVFAVMVVGAAIVWSLRKSYRVQKELRQ